LSQLNITKTEFMTNVLNILKYDAEQNLQKLRQPVDKDKWSTEPAVVNAFYNPNKNDIGKRGWSVGRAVLYLVSRLV
jgi:membrane metallo-endopeptidase-like protein 1